MQHVGPLLLFPGAEVRHHLVDAVGAQTAAKAQQHRAVPGVQLLPGGGAVRMEDLRPYRVAHYESLAGRAQLFHRVGTGCQYQIHVPRQQFVGHAGKGVLLMDGRLDAAPGRRAHHRPADVAAAADDQIRPDFVQDAAGAGPRQGQVPYRYHVAHNVLGIQAALKAVDLDMVEGIARPCDETVFHPLPAACKVDLCFRGRLLQGAGNGQGRVDMPGSTAGCDQYTHTRPPRYSMYPQLF